jgi:hypothetical protein
VDIASVEVFHLNRLSAVLAVAAVQLKGGESRELNATIDRGGIQH